MFESKKFTQEHIFKQIALQLQDKSWEQIKIKFEKLRRGYSGSKNDKKASGAAGGTGNTIYENEMHELWGNRPKFTTPHTYGVDTTKLKQLNNNEQPVDLDEIEFEATSSNISAAGSSSGDVSQSPNSTS